MEKTTPRDLGFLEETWEDFEMNGTAYETDPKTLDMLRALVADGKQASDYSAVIWAMDLGQMGGRIRVKR